MIKSNENFESTISICLQNKYFDGLLFWNQHILSLLNLFLCYYCRCRFLSLLLVDSPHSSVNEWNERNFVSGWINMLFGACLLFWHINYITYIGVLQHLIFVQRILYRHFSNVVKTDTKICNVVNGNIKMCLVCIVRTSSSWYFVKIVSVYLNICIFNTTCIAYIIIHFKSVLFGSYDGHHFVQSLNDIINGI